MIPGSVVGCFQPFIMNAAPPTPTTPSFVAAGTGSANMSGNATPSYPAGIASGDLFICAATGYLASISTPVGWTLIYGPDTAFGTQNNYIFTRDARATGSESGTVTFGSGRVSARIYAFRNCAASSPLEAHDTSSGSGGSTTAIANPTVTPPGTNRLGILSWHGYSETGAVTVTGSPSGGTWVEAADYYSSPTDIFFLELQTVDLTAGGDISGGTTTIGGYYQAFCNGFCINGT